MQHTDFRYATHPEDAKHYDSEKLRSHFLIDTLFQKGTIQLTYSMYDRFVVGGVMPDSGQSLKLEATEELKSDNFLDRRELGIINVGDPGKILVDGNTYLLNKKEALYIGKGVKEVLFENSIGGQAFFYLNSAPAHQSYPTVKVGKKNAEILELGSDEHANKRILNKLIVNSIVQTCQLQMGLTELLPGNVWNTMPAHTHTRRMEAYFYFDLDPNQAVCHLMGQPHQTRHLFIKNRQAVLSPEWSIHSGAGTSNYAFVWGMAGENLDYGDMDICNPIDLI